MLELRPSCEHCTKPLPPNSTEAMICTFECTFCKDCVENVLENVCSNCGGGFVPRPIRPKSNLKNDNSLSRYPATDQITYEFVDIEEHRLFAKGIKNIPPEER